MVGRTNTTKKKVSTNWEYSAAPESTDHISLMSNYDLFIAGKFTKPKEGLILIPLIRLMKLT